MPDKTPLIVPKTRFLTSFPGNSYLISRDFPHSQGACGLPPSEVKCSFNPVNGSGHVRSGDTFRWVQEEKIPPAITFLQVRRGSWAPIYFAIVYWRDGAWQCSFGLPSRSRRSQRVETLLRQWELSLETTLPRPVVLEGDLGEVDLGLDNRTLNWIERHCTSVLHNAASLVFRGDDPDGEPYLSNVEGTRRMLELCRCTGIRQFHHVSTAYVCGLREGRVLETEVNLGQTPGNVYEKTKLQAEMLVRTADFLDSPTIFRPSIIVGDSQTGYTTTYHGFYAPLKLAHTMASKVARGARGAICSWRRWASGRRPQELRARRLGLRRDLPHPWPAGVPWHDLPRHFAVSTLGPGDGRRTARGRRGTLADGRSRFELEPGRRMVRQDLPRPVGDLRRLLARRPAVRHDQYAACHAASALSEFGPRDDDAACPLRHRRELRPRAARKHKPEFDVHNHMRRLLHGRSDLRSHGETRLAHLGIEVDGPGGGQWELAVRDGRVVAIDDGVSPRSTAVFHVHSATFRSLVLGEFSVSQAVQTGQVRIEGNGMDRRRLEAVLQATTTAASRKSLGGRICFIPLPPGLRSRGPATVRRIDSARRANDGCGQTARRPAP